MTLDQHSAQNPAGPPVQFTIDGEPFTSDERALLASTLLTKFAKVDPANYDLGELHGKDPNPRVYADAETVHLHPGARFVTLRTGPGPVE
jgi:hypothetical protein